MLAVFFHEGVEVLRDEGEGEEGVRGLSAFARVEGAVMQAGGHVGEVGEDRVLQFPGESRKGGHHSRSVWRQRSLAQE